MLEEVNRKILKLLMEGRGITELSELISESKESICARISKLEERGIIKGYSPDVDWEKLGRELLMYEEWDELDEKILNTIIKGAHIKPEATGIAKEIGENEHVVKLRISRLELRDIILGYKPEINWGKLGYKLTGFIGITCPPELERELIDKLGGEETVSKIWEILAGTFDLLIKCRFKDREEIKELCNSIREIEGVKEADIWLVAPISSGSK